MIRRLTMLLAFVAGTLLATTHTAAAQGTLTGPLKTQWENTRNLVLNMADMIPEEKYDWKPTPEVRSFRDQLVHLVQENYMYMGFAAGEPQDTSRFNNLKTKAEIVPALKESYDYGAKVWAGIDEKKALEMVAFRNNQAPRWQPILAVIVDNMDHYGNLVVYVRLNGMVPPRTAARQQQPPQR